MALSLFRLHSETKMKSVLSRSLARAGLVLLLGSATVLFLTAAQKKEARVSQAVRDVNLLAPGTTDRPAHLNENITDGSAVHTGVASRAELTFPDLTITRIGANSIFSFEEHGASPLRGLFIRGSRWAD